VQRSLAVESEVCGPSFAVQLHETESAECGMEVDDTKRKDHREVSWVPENGQE